jgi:hypothetical protein
MPIRVDVVSDFAAFDNAVTTLEKFPAIVSEVAQDTLQEFRPALLQELAIEPPPAHKPVIWQTEKQRRWFFAQVAAGNIEVPYKRTGGATRDWTAELVEGDGLVAFSVSNPNKYLRYVRGRQGGRTGDQIQRQHKATGWTESAPIINRHIENAKRVFLQKFWARIDALLKG